LTSQEYTFNFANGIFTVNQAVISVTGPSLTMIYGGAVPSLSYRLSGFVNGDTAAVLFGSPLVASSVTAVSPAGVYPVTVAAGSLSSPNYAFSMANGAITVKKALLIVVASSQNMTYGTAVPVLTYTFSGFVNGDSQQTTTTGTPQMSTTAIGSSVAGSYPIVPALGSLAAQNYVFGFTPGSMKVNKATLTVTANNLSMQAGGTVPALTYSMNGWVNGESQATATTGAPTLSTSAISQAGSYTIIVVPGSLKATNYQFAMVNGTLVVTQSSANLHRTLVR
jgi:hypothetical protein